MREQNLQPDSKIEGGLRIGEIFSKKLMFSKES